MRGPPAQKLYGAPVLNEAGHLLGVFAETAEPMADNPVANLHLHYVPVSDAEQVERWISDRDEQWWVPPVVVGSGESPSRE